MLLTGHDQEVADWYAMKREVPFVPYHFALGLLDGDGALRGAFILQMDTSWTASTHLYSELDSLAPHARQIFEWLFAHAHRLTAVTHVKNKKMKKHLPRLGFKFEGRKKEFYGPGEDALSFYMTADQCRWINQDGQPRRSSAAAA
jgi:hypothetical protein